MTDRLALDHAPILDVCPVCGGADRLTLAPDWRARVNRGEAIPIVACGNPWHYVDALGQVVIGDDR